jgi:YARHG domain
MIRLLTAFAFLLFIVNPSSASAQNPPTNSQMQTWIFQIRNQSNLEHREMDSITSRPHLRVLRNAIYARHGLIFKSGDLTEYFSKFDWYKPRFASVEGKFTSTDSSNLRTIRWRETDCEVHEYLLQPSPDSTFQFAKADAELVGIWQDFIILAAGWSRRYCIFQNGRILWCESQMVCNKRLIARAGYWNHIGDRIEIQYTHELVEEGGYLVVDPLCGSYDSLLINALPFFRPLPKIEKEIYFMSPILPDDDELYKDMLIPRMFLNSNPYWKKGTDPWDWR